MNEQSSDKKMGVTNKNLKRSLISVGLLVLSALTYVLGVDSLYLGHSGILSWTLIILFYGLTALAAISAVKTLINTLSTIKTATDRRNYIALALCALVIIAVVRELLHRL